MGPPVLVSFRAGLQFCLPSVGGDGRPQSERASPVIDPGGLADPRGPSWRRGGPTEAPSVLWQRCQAPLVVSVLADGGLQAHLESRFLVGGVGGGWSPPSCPCAPRRLRKRRQRRVGERTAREEQQPLLTRLRPESRAQQSQGPISSSTAPPPTCCASLGNLLPASEPVPHSPARGPARSLQAACRVPGRQERERK